MAAANMAFLDQIVGYLSTLDIPGRRDLATFLGVKEQTLRSWKRRKTVPSGIRTLRMHYLLAETGAVNTSWRCTDDVLQDAGRLVAFRVVTVCDIVRRINDVAVDDSRVVQFLSGHDHVKPEFYKVFEAIVQEHNWYLPSVLQKWEHLCVGNGNSQKIATLAAKIVAILPLCEEMVSNDWTPEERQELRERCGSDVVFRLYNTMGALCGERARQHQLKSAVSMLTRKTS
jgi:hypothetical protein